MHRSKKTDNKVIASTETEAAFDPFASNANDDVKESEASLKAKIAELKAVNKETKELEAQLAKLQENK